MEKSLDERRVAALESIAFELKRANDARESEDDRLLNISEAAEFCGVSRQTVAAWIREGKIEKKYKGGRSGIALSDLRCRAKKHLADAFRFMNPS